MNLEIETNPNCEGTDYQVFLEMGPWRTLSRMTLLCNGQKIICHLSGVDPNGKFIPAKVCPVADSGGGSVFLIYGGRWGLRFKPEEFGHEPWDLGNPHQWGEPFKYYADEVDFIYGEG